MMVVSRRGFIAGLSAASAGLALGLGNSKSANAKIMELTPSFAPNAFVQIDTGGLVTIVCHRSEMGQGIRSSLPVLIADELGANHANVRVVQGDGDIKYGDQNTDGSTSIRDFYDAMRQVGAVARTMLITVAAKRWKVPVNRLNAHDDAVHDPISKRKTPFAELVVEAATLPVPSAKNVKLRPNSELTSVGSNLPLRDAPAFVTGAALYAADIKLPSMLVAVIARPPAVFGSVDKLDDSKARAIAGVKQIMQIASSNAPALSKPLGGVAVLADNTWAAMRGRAALEITWNGGDNGAVDSSVHTDAMIAAVKTSGSVVRNIGDANAALSSASKTVEATYLVPQLAHAAMEPPAAIARFVDGKCEVWTCTQSPQDAVDEVASALGIDKSKVTVHVTFLGGGFGRKSIPDYVVEAALLSRDAKVPVRVQWTREDDIRHGYFHAPSAQLLTAGIDGNGAVTAWRHRIAYPSIGSTFLPTTNQPQAFELGQGILDLPLNIANVTVETCKALAPARIGWMRSVANIQQAFAVQSFIAELAHETKRDQRDMLLQILGPTTQTVTTKSLGVKDVPNYGASLTQHPISLPRFHRVIDTVCNDAQWDAKRRAGVAVGLAVHRSFLSYVAVIVSVKKGPRGNIVVDEAWIAADCGTLINADRVRSQFEGAFTFGQTIALHGAITMKNGAVEQSNFRDYPLIRIGETPRNVHVNLIRHDGPPGGVGEPGVPPVAPAIANAVFALSGQRLRKLPIVVG
jgi:isoquinoline 1-oxidoreductase subunit beta